MEHILHSQTMQHLEAFYRLSTYCQTNSMNSERDDPAKVLILTLHDLNSELDEGQQIDAILLDFSKALSKVPYARLANKCRHYGIPDDVIQWVQSFLSERTQHVLVEGQSPAAAAVTSRGPQGTALGPLLFLLYSNDPPGKVNSTYRLFADDSLLYLKISSASDAAALHTKILIGSSNGNVTGKCYICVVVRVIKRRNPANANYQIQGHGLTICKNGKYLDVVISEDLS